MTNQTLRAAQRLQLRLDDGLRLEWGEPDWLGPLSFAIHQGGAWRGFPSRAPGPNPAMAPLPLAVAETSGGSDDLGTYRQWTWRWAAEAVPVSPSVRAYDDLPLIVFRLQATADLPDNVPTGAYASPSVVWPLCLPQQRRLRGVPADTRTFAHQLSEFALPVFGDDCGRGFFFAPHRPAAVSPLLWIAPDLRCLMLAPLDHFHEQTIAVVGAQADERDTAIRCGWHGDLAEVPAGFTTDFALWAGTDPREVLDAWASVLLRRHGTRRPGRYADELSAKLSYWTDNGATYYYRTAPGCDYGATLERAVEDLRQRRVPIASVQVDSWFYPHEQLRPVSPEGAPIVPPTGALRWEPREDLFPEGLGGLRARLGNLPLTFHARHFSRLSPYFERFESWQDGDYAHPSDPRFFQMLMAQAVAWGAIVYEQDWMVESFFGIRGLRQAPGRARQWQEAMDHAAREHGLHLQWCMSTPADFMQTVSLSEVTSIRTSGDYRYLFDNGLNWVWFLHTNALARALGLWPYKDVFVSHGPTASSAGEPYAEIEALLAALSAGPVGIGDEIGATNRELVMRTCREDGVLLKPDAPIAASGACFRANRFTAPELLLGETFSRHPAGTWVYVVAFNAFQGRQRIEANVRLGELGELRPSGAVIAYDWRRREWQRLETAEGFGVGLDFQDWDYRILCPVLPGEITVFGDVTKYVPLADRRIADIAIRPGGLSFLVYGPPRSAVEIRGWSERSPRSMSSWSPAGGRELRRDGDDEGWSWDAERGEWRVSARVGDGGFSRVEIVSGS